MTTRGKWIAGGVAVLLCAGGAGAYFALHHGKAGGPGEGGQQGIVRVQVVTPQQGGVERIVTRPCSVHSFQYANLYAKVTGYLENQDVDIGRRVKKEQFLAEIFAPEITADVTKAQADLAKAESEIEVMKAAVAEANAELKESYSGEKRAAASLEFHRRKYTRYKNLAAKGGIEPELVDEQFEARQTAEATLDQAKNAILTAKAKVSRAEADLANAKAVVEVAKAVLIRARAIQEYTRIRSPYDGVITARNYHDGDLIQANDVTRPPILSVARTDLMRVIMWVPDPDVPYVHDEDLAEIRIDALPGRVFHGKVARTAMSESFTSRQMRTEVDLENKDGALTDGMYGKMTLYLGKTTTGLTVPSSALIGNEKADKRNIYVVHDGKARELAVRVGEDDGIRAHVRSGLHGDEQVIVTHGPGLADGTPVEVTGEWKPPEFHPKTQESE
jgi:HlyD family secretion protein